MTNLRLAGAKVLGQQLGWSAPVRPPAAPLGRNRSPILSRRPARARSLGEPLGDVPDAQGAIEGRPDRLPAVAAEDAVGQQGVGDLVVIPLAARGEVPDPQVMAVAADGARAVGRDGEAKDPPRAVEAEDLAARLHVPEAEVLVVAAGQEPPAVGQERHARHPGVMSLEADDLRAGVEVPDARRAVLGGGGGPAAVGADRQARDAAPVSAEAADLL